jgi:hypothetical protein
VRRTSSRRFASPPAWLLADDMMLRQQS